MSGKFQVDREIFDNGIWNNVSEFRLFFYILGNAIWKDGGVSIGNVKVNRGQYIRSYRKLRDDLMYTENNAIKYYSLSHIKKMVDKLVKDERISIEETELGTLFTVCNYERYQRFDNFGKVNQEQPENTPRTEGEQPENNKKKVKKVKNKDILSQIENLRHRYTDNDLRIVDEFMEVIKFTRVSGKIADSVTLKMYQEFEKHPTQKVLYGLQKYINNPALHDKKENYVYGIIRNTKASEIEYGKAIEKKQADPYAGIDIY